jgi:hypothetical protein
VGTEKVAGSPAFSAFGGGDGAVDDAGTALPQRPHLSSKSTTEWNPECAARCRGSLPLLSRSMAGSQPQDSSVWTHSWWPKAHARSNGVRPRQSGILKGADGPWMALLVPALVGEVLAHRPDESRVEVSGELPSFPAAYSLWRSLNISSSPRLAATCHTFESSCDLRDCEKVDDEKVVEMDSNSATLPEATQRHMFSGRSSFAFLLRGQLLVNN